MSFPIGDYELTAALVGHEEAFATFNPRSEVTLQSFNLSCAAGRLRAFFFLRDNLPSVVFIHVFGYLLHSLNLAVHPYNGKIVLRSSLATLEHVISMYSYRDNPLVAFKDQDVMITKLIHNRSKLADGCCRKCGNVTVRAMHILRECHWMPYRRCSQRGKPGHLHYGAARVLGSYTGSMMRYVCFTCTNWGYHLNAYNDLCDMDGRVLTTTRLAENM